MLKAKIPLYGLMFAIVTLLFLPSYAQAAVGDDLPARAVHSFRAEDFCLINENKGSSEQRTAILRSGIVAALGYAKNQDSSFLQAIEESAKRGNCSHL